MFEQNNKGRINNLIKASSTTSCGIDSIENCTDSPRRISETESIILKLGNSVCDTIDIISSIEKKLEPITRQPTIKEELERDNVEYETSIAQEIEKSVRNIQHLNDRLFDLKERIEL